MNEVDDEDFSISRLGDLLRWLMRSTRSEMMEIGNPNDSFRVAFFVCSEEPRYRLMLDPMVLDPLERGHHDKDPSKDDGNEVNSTNTFEGFG